jgi:phage terminase large subunit-like protein
MYYTRRRMMEYTPEYFLQDVEPDLLAFPEGRRELTRLNPMLFALIYLPHHLMDGDNNITLSEFHVDVANSGLRWCKKAPEPMEIRDAFIAPRECGKSTWVFTILPMWAAAHNHVKFLAAFSDSAAQAQGHLLTFKNELDTNDLLKTDYPDLCRPKKSSYTGRPLAQSADRIWQDNDFVFDANGIDTNSLGKKAGTQRPDLIILDDIEKGEKNYSEYQATRQRDTVFDDIAPMNMKARMVFVGTTTMPNSVMDQFRKYAEDYDEQELKWIKEQNVQVHYWPAILSDETGAERSIWPAKWSLEWLQSQRHTRTFAKNFMNKPLATDGQFWSDNDVRLAEAVAYGNTILSVDPAVTKNKVSDYTGLAVLSRGQVRLDSDTEAVYVRHAEQFKGTPEQLAARVAHLVEVYEVGVLYVETNQGGDLWQSVFKDIDVKYRSVHQKISKEIRAGRALDFYQKKMVFHTSHFPALEEQMYSFPKVKHDDVLDAVVSGVLYFLGKKTTSVMARQFNYIGGR